MDALMAQRRFTGAVRVRIGKDGHVIDAAIAVATDPDYDKQLLEAAAFVALHSGATEWRANRDGEIGYLLAENILIRRRLRGKSVSPLAGPVSWTLIRRELCNPGA